MADYVSPDARRRIATGLMAAQYDRATPEEGNVAQRHGLLPLATYDNGQTGLAFPGFVADPVQSFNRLMQNGYTPGDTQGVEDAFNVAGAAMMGGMLSPRPRSVVKPTEAVPQVRQPSLYEQAFPRDPATGRMLSADGKPIQPFERTQTFEPRSSMDRMDDFSLPSNFDNAKYSVLREYGLEKMTAPEYGFRGSMSNAQKFRNENSRGVWASDNPFVADAYTETPGIGQSNIMPMRFDFRKPLVVPGSGANFDSIPVRGTNGFIDTQTLADIAKADGRDGLVIRNVKDAPDGGEVPSNIYHAFERGTVYSPLTGELLYANGGRPGATAGATLGAIPDMPPSYTSRIASRMAPAERPPDINPLAAIRLPDGRIIEGQTHVNAIMNANLTDDLLDKAQAGWVVNGNFMDRDQTASFLSGKNSTGYDGLLSTERLNARDLGQKVVKDGDGWRVLRYGETPLPGTQVYANGGRPGAATGAALGAIPDMPPSYTSRVNAQPPQPLFTARGYHGTGTDDLLRNPLPDSGPWGSSSPQVAETYSKIMADDVPSILPLEYRFSNPQVVDAGGRRFGLTTGRTSINTDVMAARAREAGHDGIVFNNIRDAAGSDLTQASTYAPLKPGTTYSATTGDLLYANGGRPGAATGAALGAIPDTPGIRAYHGSPHDFDRFDSSKIGTGEGAQAYGHGLYMAESEDVAKIYRGAGPRQQWSSLDPPNNPGHMYEVNIKATPDDFLDWDKPLSQQSEHIRKSMTDLANGEILPDWNGMQAYRSVGSQMMSNLDLMSPELAQRVKGAGIPGVKYLDQGSRTGLGEGTSNYVVFDDKLIEILRKYGLLGMAGGAAAAEYSSPQNQMLSRPASPRYLPGDA